MKEKQSKKIKMPAEYDAQRETRVLLEGMDSNIRLIAEQHGTIVKKLEEHDRRFDMIESAVLNVDNRVRKLEQGQVQLFAGQAKLTADVEQLKAGQERLEQGQTQLFAGQGRLEQRQEKLEQGQEEIKQKLDTVVVDYGRRICNLEEAVR